MLRSHVTIQIAFLSEPALANGTDKLWLHTAFILLMPPQRCEKRIDTIAPHAYMLLLRLPRFLVIVLRLPLVRLSALVALECLVTQQRGFQGECPTAIVAEILTRTRNASATFRGHRAKASRVHSDARCWRQGGYRPVGRTVCRTYESRREEIKLS